MHEKENGCLLTYGEQAKNLLVSHLYDEKTTANGLCDWFKAHYPMLQAWKSSKKPNDKKMNCCLFDVSSCELFTAMTTY